MLAIDVGTTTVKAGVLDGQCKLMGLGRRPQVNVASEIGWHEHDPDSTLAAVVGATREALDRGGLGSRELAAIAVAGPRGTFAGLAGDGSSTTRFITWQDQRAAASLGAWSSEAQVRDLYKVTGCRFEPSTVLPKLVWLSDHEPARLAAIAQLATPQGFVLNRLGASKPSVDFSSAAHFGLFDVARLEWSDEIVARFELDPKILPPTVAPGTVVGHSGGATTAELDLPAGIPLVAAGSDGVCSELGAAVVDQGQIYGYLGTATAVAGPMTALNLDPLARLIVMPGSRSDRWRVLALAMAGASALDWFGRVSQLDVRHGLAARVASSPPGARGVRFMPTLAGAGSPFWASQARGAFLGLSLAADVADMTRAVLEGIALEMRWMVQSLSTMRIEPDVIHLTGGGSRSDAWAQIIADVIQVQVARIDEPEPGLRGAAFYALAASGMYDSALDAAVSMPPAQTTFQPQRSFGDLYASATEVYGRVRGTFQHSDLDAALLKGGQGSARQQSLHDPVSPQ